MNGNLPEVACLLLLIAFIAMLAIKLRARRNYHHRRMIKAADRALQTLRPIATKRPGAIILYVRKMHPHAVEELVLTAAARAGHRIRRNAAYVGDGGMDGMIEIAGIWHLVQTKRYASAIKPDHVHAFAALCASRNTPGLFVHFGRTGPMSRAAQGQLVNILSGSRLTDLIAGKPIAIQTNR